MKKLLYIGGGSLLLLLTLAFGAFFAGPLVASANTTSTPTTPTTTQTTKTAHPEHPLREFVNNHSDALVDQIAPQLHLTADQLTQKLQSGERIVRIAKDEGISLSSLKTILVTSTDNVIQQALNANQINQQHAEQLKDLVQNHPFVVSRTLHRHYTK